MARGTYQQGTAREQPFTEFAPDLDPTSAGIILDADNAVPTIKGFMAGLTPEIYLTLRNFVPETPLPGVRGASECYFSNGQTALVVGTIDHLYMAFPLVGGPWLQIDNGQTFALGANDRWRFFQFGDDIIAVAGATVVPQLGDGLNLPASGFNPLPGSPPGSLGNGTGPSTGCSAAGIAFLFRGQEWFASAAGVDNNWVPNTQTLAANGILTDFPGPIVAAAPFYRSVIVAKEQAMWLGSFVGPPNSWSFQLISEETGCRAQEAMVVLPDAVAFLGTDDFYITTGSIPTRIQNSLKEWFFDTADLKQLHKVQGSYDTAHAIITWNFISNNTPFPGVCDLYVSYNVRARRWVKGRRLVSIIPQPNQSVKFTAPSFFDEQGFAKQLSGPPGPMILLTGWTGTPGRLTQLMRVRAKYNVLPTVQRMTAWGSDILQAIPPFPSLTIPALGYDDWFNMRTTWRYHQIGLSTEGPVEVCGLAFEGRLAGIR